ncbi:MAG: YceI family protein [Chitinophagaceae bacterium]|nr:YceI family protein [Chitinophagaceae bacterium]
MKQLFFSLCVLASLQSTAQRYMTKTGTVDFVATGAIEKIEGSNKSVACLLDSKAGSLDFIIQIKSFVFEKQLMQEHFNENYMESDKFPKASFKGSVTNMTSINMAKDGEYTADVVGKLMIHGVTKDVKSTGKVIVKGGKPILKSAFSVLLAVYGIEIPGAVKDKISKDVKINVHCALDAMK